MADMAIVRRRHRTMRGYRLTVLFAFFTLATVFVGLGAFLIFAAVEPGAFLLLDAFSSLANLLR
jgi:hypothetical protein